jgi:Uncharacterized protein conserved in bacteria (DUF2252)
MMSTQTAEATAHGALRYQLDTGLGELTPAERAHARSGDRVAIAAYLGGSDVFDQAITRFAAAYADQNERDHQALVDAVDSGRLTAGRDT